MSDALSALADEVARLAVPRIAEAVVAEVGRQLRYQDDPLMTVLEASAHSGLSQTKIRELVRAKVLKKAPGMDEIRIRRSILDAYGK